MQLLKHEREDSLNNGKMSLSIKKGLKQKDQYAVIWHNENASLYLLTNLRDSFSFIEVFLKYIPIMTNRVGIGILRSCKINFLHPLRKFIIVQKKQTSKIGLEIAWEKKIQFYKKTQMQKLKLMSEFLSLQSSPTGSFIQVLCFIGCFSTSSVTAFEHYKTCHF